MYHSPLSHLRSPAGVPTRLPRGGRRHIPVEAWRSSEELMRFPLACLMLNRNAFHSKRFRRVRTSEMPVSLSQRRRHREQAPGSREDEDAGSRGLPPACGPASSCAPDTRLTLPWAQLCPEPRYQDHSLLSKPRAHRFGMVRPSPSALLCSAAGPDLSTGPQLAATTKATAVTA